MVMICVSLNLLFRIRPPGVILARKPLLFNGPVFGEGYTAAFSSSHSNVKLMLDNIRRYEKRQKALNFVYLMFSQSPEHDRSYPGRLASIPFFDSNILQL